MSKSVVMTFPNGSTYTPSLEEEVLPEDETTGYPNRIPTFHGYSWTGDAEGELVYVGRGQQVDFERLVELGVELEGKIALARYGGPFRGLKVKNSQKYGMLGTIIYTDLADDGNNTYLKGVDYYPNGPARNPSSVQRGSVQFLSTYPGDPTTPGYPSKEGSPRTGTELVTPRIPSIPISWNDAAPILEALGGNGPSGAEINRTNWVGAADTDYSSGPAPGVTVSMSNVMKDNITTIWNAIGVINGTSEDEVVIVGNHRDAWIIGGADPNSGTAAVDEMAKAFGALLQTGWKPRRTIVFASWDAEEYGLVGSTEWVEEYVPWIKAANVAYINLDVAVSGPVPSISATPDWHEFAIATMKKVVFPYHGLTNVTMYDVWLESNKGKETVGVLGSGSDYTAFLHNNGISCIDMGSDPGPTDPVYHYHSNYDTYHWMANFADVGFKYHKAMGQYAALLAYHMADDEVLPLQSANYGAEMSKYLTTLQGVIETAEADIDLSELVTAIETFNTSAAAFTELYSGEMNADTAATINTKLRDYQRGFVSNGGLPDRSYFRHVVFAPGVDTGYAPVTWPGITEAVNAGNMTLAQSEVSRAAVAVQNAAEILMP